MGRWRAIAIGCRRSDNPARIQGRTWTSTPRRQCRRRQCLICQWNCAVRLSLIVGAFLMSLKLLAYYLTHSTAIFSDAMENVVNVLSSIFALYAVRLAAQPPDQDHPYGHGKVEFFFAGFEGGMIVLAAVLIAATAVQALAMKQGPKQLNIGLGVTALSAVLCATMGILLRNRGRISGSITLQSDAVHLLSDAVTGGVVVAALLAVRWTGRGWIDPVAALCLAGWVAGQGIGLMRRGAAGLMDEQDVGDTRLLQSILDGHCGSDRAPPRICGYHKLRHRHSGRHHWVDFHIQVPADWQVDQGHRAATVIEMEIERKLGDCNATAHVEPCVDERCGRCKKGVKV